MNPRRARGVDRAKHLAGGCGEKGQQVELLRCQLDPLVVDEYVAGGALDGEAVELDERRCRVVTGSAEYRADSSGELTGRERFDHVVIGAEFEAEDTIGLFGASGEQDHRDVRNFAHLGEDREPVELRQHDVENDEVRRGLIDQVERGSSVGRFGHREALTGEVRGDHLAHHGLVVDNEHTSPVVGSGSWHGTIVRSLRAMLQGSRPSSAIVHQPFRAMKDHSRRLGASRDREYPCQ